MTVGIISGYGVPPLLVLSLHLQVPSRISSCLLVPSFHPNLSTPSVPHHHHLRHLHHRRYLYSISLIALATLCTLVYIHTYKHMYMCVCITLSPLYSRARYRCIPPHTLLVHHTVTEPHLPPSLALATPFAPTQCTLILLHCPPQRLLVSSLRCRLTPS